MSDQKTPPTILYLSAVSFFLACNYFILKATKEALLVTAPDAGAEAIPFVKMWLLFPATIIFLGAFTWMGSRISMRFAVTSMITFLLGCYALFTFVFYPLSSSLHLNGVADRLLLSLPEGWKALAAVVRYWSYSLFYVAAECWCTLVYSVVFWGYANAAIKFVDAKKYYPYLTLAGTTAALLAGPLTIFMTSEGFRFYFPVSSDRWAAALYGLTFVVLFNGACALWIFLKRCPQTPAELPQGSNPPYWASFIKTLRSKYLLTLAAMCLTYNLLINLTDVVWKNEVLKLYPNPSDYTAYLSGVTVFTGVISTFLTLFVCRQSLQKFGWTKTALITPLVALSTGGLFFFAQSLSEYASASISLQLVAFLGSMHICLSSAGKYTLFEPTKELAFIPLPQSEKLHGKAVIDGVGARLGKTSSSMIYQMLLVVLPSISACTPIIGVLLIVVIAGCMSSIIALGRRIENTAAPSLDYTNQL